MLCFWRRWGNQQLGLEERGSVEWLLFPKNIKVFQNELFPRLSIARLFRVVKYSQQTGHNCLVSEYLHDI